MIGGNGKVGGRSVVFFVFVGGLLLLAAVGARAWTLVDEFPAGKGGSPDDGSWSPAVSADGRYVAFHSSAANLVDNDANNCGDVFLLDRQTGETTLVSKSSAGVQGDAISWNPSISSGGRYIAFQSSAKNLVTDDANGVDDIFVHDRPRGATVRASMAANGREANGPSSSPSISADGLMVSFHSEASNLVRRDANGQTDVFVRDLNMGVVERMPLEGNKISVQAATLPSAPTPPTSSPRTRTA